MIKTISVFLLAIISTIGLIPAQTYDSDIRKIIWNDTELNISGVENIRYYLLAGEQEASDIIQFSDNDAISMDSVVDVGNLLSLIPLHYYLSLRKYSNASGTHFNKMMNEVIVEELNLEDFIFQQSKLPKNPRFNVEGGVINIRESTEESLIALARNQEQTTFCQISELNSLLAIHILESYLHNLQNGGSNEPHYTFAKAKTGKASFNELSLCTMLILNNFNQFNNEACESNLKGYVMQNGFYKTSINDIDLYVMSGKTATGNAFIAMTPETERAILLLSSGKSKEVIDLGYLIIRMLNNKWKMKNYGKKE